MTFGICEFTDAAYDKSWYKFVSNRKGPSILVTKDFKKLRDDHPYLMLENVIVHATITGYGSSFLEPNVTRPEIQLTELSRLTKDQKRRVVIRIDPIVPLDDFVSQSERVYHKARELGFERIRVSILDLYPHVLLRLDPYHDFKYQIKNVYNWDMSHSLGEDKEYMHHAPLDLRRRILDRFPGSEVCGEPGVRCSGCVSWRDLEALGLNADEVGKPAEKQRPFCQCLEKKELTKLTTECPLKCLYCFKY